MTRAVVKQVLERCDNATLSWIILEYIPKLLFERRTTK